MKYVIMETEEGQQLPFAFPEAITHVFAAAVLGPLIEACLNTKAQAVSAGFVYFNHANTSGASESMGGLESNPVDGDRFVFGSSVEFLPDDIVALTAKKVGPQ